MTFDKKAIQFIDRLHYTGKPLPAGIRVMNPFAESPQAMRIARDFYRKYYSDSYPRYLILGINPGRFGAGLTGIPFTDPKRLVSECGIAYDGKPAHEPSSVFIYEMINAYGGPRLFYRDFYINSICPLGFTITGKDGNEKNYNYYDSVALSNAVEDFIVDNIYSLLKMGVRREICFCFGTGQNEKYLRKINQQHGFFEKIVPLEHPRYIMQYKSAVKNLYIDKYISAFGEIKKAML